MAKTEREHLAGEGFKQYDRLRKYLGLIYLYGCFEAEELAKVNARSVKDYNVVIGLILDLFWPNAATGKEKRQIKRNPHIMREYARSAQNRMTDSYMMFSMDRVSLLLTYLCLLQRLGAGKATARQLADALERLQDAYCAFFDDRNMGDAYQNARNHALELVQYGYASFQDGQFQLEADGLQALKDEAVQELHRYVCFASSVTYPRVPGSFLRRTLERELLHRGLTPFKGSECILRHNSNHNVFDEEVVFRLLHMIEKRQALVLEGVEYLPVKLRVDCRLGRWYVLMAIEQEGVWKPSIRAVSRLELPAPSDNSIEKDRWERARAAVEDAYENCLFSGKQVDTPVLVETRLHFEAERGRRDQFARELRLGGIEGCPEGEVYRAAVNDPLELLPQLRAYAPWLTVLPGEHDLDRRMQDSLCRMQENLDGAQWEMHRENDRSFAKKAGEPAVTEKKKTDRDSGERKLLTPFQGRLLQFCLDLLAYGERGTKDKEYFEKELAQRYAIQDPGRVMEQLREAGFLGSQEPLRLPMSQVEREYLQYILDPRNMPEAELFLSPETRSALQGKVPGWIGHIQWMKAPGMDLPENPGSQGFRELLRAIRERRMIAYRYRESGKNEEQETTCLPWKVEYSAYDRRWWVILYDSQDKRTIKARLNHLRGIQVLEESPVTEGEIMAAMEKLRMENHVILRIRDAHNALQRCFTAFENQEIVASSYSPETGYTLEFHAFRFDEEEILRQLMYLGPNVRLEAPEELREKLQDRLEKAKKWNFCEENLFSTDI